MILIGNSIAGRGHPLAGKRGPISNRSGASRPPPGIHVLDLSEYRLPTAGQTLIFDIMKHSRCLLLTLMLLVPGESLLAQDAKTQASALATQREAEERLNRLNALVEDMRDAYEAQQKKINALAAEIRAFREEQNRSGVNTATREDVRKLAEKIQEVDQKREADKKLILEEIKKLAALAAAPPPATKTIEPKRVENPDDSDGQFFKHVVQKDQRLHDILAEYNKRLKEQGKPSVKLDQVKKANPGLDPDRLRIGQEIFIPVPK